MSADFATKPLRRYLESCAYHALPWTLGVNIGPTPQLLDGLRARLISLCREGHGKISLIGISLGGLMARHMAHEFPDKVAQVITMASPYRLPTAATIEPLFNLVAPRFSKEIDFLRVAQPLPVPAMSIYTRQDGIVAWESCSEESSLSREIDSPHTTIARHPEALRAVALRLHEARFGHP
jgi:pimeloyl-ACP methyl ester carboxylesterase